MTKIPFHIICFSLHPLRKIETVIKFNKNSILLIRNYRIKIAASIPLLHHFGLTIEIALIRKHSNIYPKLSTFNFPLNVVHIFIQHYENMNNLSLKFTYEMIQIRQNRCRSITNFYLQRNLDSAMHYGKY